jgi:hypothetical protein
MLSLGRSARLVLPTILRHPEPSFNVDRTSADAQAAVGNSGVQSNIRQLVVGQLNEILTLSFKWKSTQESMKGSRKSQNWPILLEGEKRRSRPQYCNQRSTPYWPSGTYSTRHPAPAELMASHGVIRWSEPAWSRDPSWASERFAHELLVRRAFSRAAVSAHRPPQSPTAAYPAFSARTVIVGSGAKRRIAFTTRSCCSAVNCGYIGKDTASADAASATGKSPAL